MNSANSHPIHPARRTRELRAGFTLLEIMIVVALIGIVMTAGAPTHYNALQKEGFRKTVSDIVDVCSTARARAILHGQTTEVVFYPLEGRCEVSGGKVSATMAHTATIGDTARIEMLDVNLTEYKDAEMARVRFFPNGTSDEFTLVIVSDRNEWRKISTEITTGMTSVESDPNKWR